MDLKYRMQLGKRDTIMKNIRKAVDKRAPIRAFELINNVTAPPRLHACAHTEPYWLNTCEPGTMAEATQWLNEQTENWRRRR